MKTDANLHNWMEKVGITSFSKLQQLAHLSRRSMDTIRQGKAQTLRYLDLFQLAEILQISLTELMSICSELPTPIVTPDQLAIAKTTVIQSALQTLEPWLLQWPVVVHTLQQKPDLPAQNLLPLLRPLDALLQEWQIIPIGTIGEIVSYDPRYHQPLNNEEMAIGAIVQVCYVGYHLAEKLLYRAKVQFAPKDDSHISSENR